MQDLFFLTRRLRPWSSQLSSQWHRKVLGGIVDEGIERLIGGWLDHNLAAQAVAVVEDDLTGAFGCNPSALMYVQATASIRDFNMTYASFCLGREFVAGSVLTLSR